MNLLETTIVVNAVLWIITACLWGIDKMMKRKQFIIAWADCGQIICFVDTVVFVFSFILLGCDLLLFINISKLLALGIYILVMLFGFIAGVVWKFSSK